MLSTPRVGLLALLKTFQCLGYFVPLSEVPDPILQHVARHAGCTSVPADLKRHDATSARRRHMLFVRDYLGVKAWGEEAQAAMQEASRAAARTLEDLADIINFALEELIRQRFELSAFSVLHRAAQNARATVNREYQASVWERLTEDSLRRLHALNRNYRPDNY